MESLDLFKMQDHLHIRGEYQTQPALSNVLPGSPPHTWRILQKIMDLNGEDRITSTYVENTNFINNWHNYAKDHLHIRGEY